jgi:hypothetical protein
MANALPTVILLKSWHLLKNATEKESLLLSAHKIPPEFLLNAIMSIPISSTNQADFLIWRGTAKGMFSVKSAYHLEKEREARSKGECLARVDFSELLRIQWKLHIPHAEKNF